MASWVSLTLDTTPPDLDVDVDPGLIGTTLVVPFTLNEGVVAAELTLPNNATVTGEIVGSTIEFDIPVIPLGQGSITFTVIDDVLNEDEIIVPVFIGTDLPAPVHHGVLQAIQLTGFPKGVLNDDGFTTIFEIDNDTGIVVLNESMSGVIPDESLTGAEDQTGDKVVEPDEHEYGVIPWEPTYGVIEDDSLTSAINQVSRGLIPYEPALRAIGLRDGVLTAVISTISVKAVVEPPLRLTQALPIDQVTGIVSEEPTTGVIE